jgi:hypothetical protein
MAVTDLGTLTREHAYALAALDACVAELERTPPGWRNNRLYAIAYRLGRMVGRGWIDRHIVVQRLTASCQGNRLAADDGEDSIRDPRIRLGGPFAKRDQPNSWDALLAANREKGRREAEEEGSLEGLFEFEGLGKE